jgi:ketosteroid isomerase-like protein
VALSSTHEQLAQSFSQYIHSLSIRIQPTRRAGGRYYQFSLKGVSTVKRILPLALLVAALSASNLACKKSEQSGLVPEPDKSPTNDARTTQTTTENKDQVLKDVTSIVQQYFKAMDLGDKVELERLLANDFSARWQGKDYDKDGWIEPQTGEPNIATHEIFNAELAGYTADTATLHFERRYTYKDGRPPYKVRDSANLVKRNGRWQIKNIIAGH